MLHIKDIEAFARINEALSRTGGAGHGDGFDGAAAGSDGASRLRHPAVLFARLATGMMLPRRAGEAPSPRDAALPVALAATLPASLPATLPANDGSAIDRPALPPAPPANDRGVTGIGRAAEWTAPFEDDDAQEDDTDDDTVASVDAIPLACAEVLAFPLRPRDRAIHDRGADSVGGMAYDFDLVPSRPVAMALAPGQMVGMLTRMFLKRR